MSWPGTREHDKDQPCHVPRLSAPLAIGIEIVELRREAFMRETPSYYESLD